MTRLCYHLNIEVTHRCNLRCVYCFNDSGVKHENEPDIIFWLKYLRHKLDDGLQSILITGGEPFMWPETIELLESAQQMGLKTSILSNGYKVPELAQRYSDLFKKLLVAQISLDSMNPQIHDQRRGFSGAWLQAIDAIDTFISLGVPVEISCTISTENIAELEIVGKYCQSIGAAFLARPLLCVGRAKSSPLDPLPHNQLMVLRNDVLSKGIALIPDRFAYAPDFFVTANCENLNAWR